MTKKKLKFNKKTDLSHLGGVKRQQESPNTILMLPAGIHDGCTAWRMDWVREYLNYNKLAQVQMSNLMTPFYVDAPSGNKMVNPVYVQSHAFVMQRPTHEKHISVGKQINILRERIRNSGKTPFRFIIDVDDVVHGDHISMFNAARGGFADNKRFEVFKEVVKMADELHVCSPRMAKFYKEYLGVEHVTHKPNLMPDHLYDVFYNIDEQKRRYEKHIHKPRIVWAGSPTHVDINNQNGGVDDFTNIEDFVKSTIDKYQWVFMGAEPKWLDENMKTKVEVHPWVPICDYPRKLWNLEPTILFAPLHDDEFNRCKSNIKFTEAGVMGIAGVFQDLEPYHEAPLKFNNSQELEKHFDFLLSSWENYVTVVEQMRLISEKYLMSNNKDLLKAAYFTDIDSRERLILSKKLIDIQ